MEQTLLQKFSNEIKALERVNNLISRQEVIYWFNENDIDYFNMTDLEMYIYYIKNANLEED